MTMKKPTAKQIAARKLFAERARAGTLGGKKRRTNPVKPATQYGYIVSFMVKGERKKLGHAATKTEANRIAREYHETTGRDIQVISAKDFVNEIRNKNPAPRKTVTARYAGAFGWVVRDELKGEDLAQFADREKAKQYAQAYADTHNRQTSLNKK